MKKLITIIIILVVMLFILAVAKDQIVKTIVATAIEKTVGAKISIGSFSLSLLTHTLEMKDFKMYNPSGFPKGLLIDLAYIRVDLDVPALLKKELHLRELTVELQELDLVKNKEGQLNVDSLKVSEDEEPEKTAIPAKEEMPLRIDILNLNIGKIVSKDYTASGEPLVKVYDININKTYKNITSLRQLVMLILTEPMKSAGIKGAKIYGLAALTGVGFVPIAVGTTIMGKDNAQETFAVGFNKAYDAALNVLTKSGTIKNANEQVGSISASVKGIEVTVRITEDGNKAKIKVSARKYFLPKPEIASGVIHQIKEELK